MYHVTTEQDIPSIRADGIRSRGIPDYYSPRYELDKVADRIGGDRYSSWVSRVHAVYFWETREQAVRETQDTAHYNRVVEVDASRVSGPVWQLPTNAWENVYASIERPHDISQGSEAWEKVRAVVDHAERYDGTPSGQNELWVRAPVSPVAIVDVHQI